MVDLTGRVARCTYDATLRGGGHAGGEPVSSSLSLPFFEYQGPGSERAVVMCVCGYSRIAHEVDDPAYWRGGVRVRRTVVESGTCPGFRPVGADVEDRYYCGCRGWD